MDRLRKDGNKAMYASVINLNLLVRAITCVKIVLSVKRQLSQNPRTGHQKTFVPFCHQYVRYSSLPNARF